MRITHTILAKTANASYIGTTQLRSLGYDEVIRYRNKNTVAYICVHKPSRQIVVSFRGSDRLGS